MENKLLKSLGEAAKLQQAGRSSDAQIIYDQIIKSHSSGSSHKNTDALIAIAHNNLGFIFQRKTSLHEALAHYRLASELNPKYCEAHYNLGHVLHSLGDLKEAIECYGRVVAIEPKNVDALNTLGSALSSNGDLASAVKVFKQALEINPSIAELHNNLGSALLSLGKLNAAAASFKTAIKLKPEYVNGFNNLGHVFREQGNLEGAMENYEQALKSDPNLLQTHNSIGNLLRQEKKYEEALSSFEYINNQISKSDSFGDPSSEEYWFNAKSQALECLYILGRYKELKDELASLSESHQLNRRLAAISCFVSHQLEIPDNHTFCRNPLDYIHFGSLDTHVADVAGFLEELIVDGMKEKQVWEPRHGVTKSGYLTANTIFKASDAYARLEEVLRSEITSYCEKFDVEACKYIKHWPRAYFLKGWLNRLLAKGHQRSHIHPGGWLSGCVYLKTVESKVTSHGAIKFGLHGYDLPLIKEMPQERTYSPRPGDIVLFPSSLFHSTIPFTEEVERYSIAFDLYPQIEQMSDCD